MERRFFNLNGISFQLVGDVEQAKSLVGYASKIMHLTEMVNVNNLEQVSNMRRLSSGAEIKVAIHGDQKRATIFYPPTIGIEKPKKEEKRLIQIPRRCPAIHTYNDSGEWIGITVCMSGKWGPPYRFMAVAQDNIYPFKYGRWNTSSTAERPENYNKRIIAVFPNEHNTIDYWYEIPAIHEYIPYAVRAISGDDDVVYSYEEWDDDNLFRTGTGNRNWVRSDEICIVIDPPLNWSSNESFSNFPRIVNRRYEYNYNVSFTQESLNMLWTEWESVAIWTGNRQAENVTSSIGSFIGESIEDGVVLFDEEQNTSTISIQGTREIDPVTGWYGTEETFFSETSDSHVFSTKILVGGIEHIIQEDSYRMQTSCNPHPNCTGSGDDDYFSTFRGGNVRLYQSGDGFMTLANAFFRDSERNTEFRYMMFDGEYAQYNDPDATYEIIADEYYLHRLGFNIDGKEACSNGEFSLIEITETYLE